MEMLLNLWDFSRDRMIALMGEGKPMHSLVQDSESQMTSQVAFETSPFNDLKESHGWCSCLVQESFFSNIKVNQRDFSLLLVLNHTVEIITLQ